MSAIPPKKRHYLTVPVSGSYYVHVDEEVDVNIDTLDKETLAQLVEALEAKGWRCIPPPLETATESGTGGALVEETLEYRLWEAAFFGRDVELKRVVSDIVYERIGRII